MGTELFPLSHHDESDRLWFWNDACELVGKMACQKATADEMACLKLYLVAILKNESEANLFASEFENDIAGLKAKYGGYKFYQG